MAKLYQSKVYLVDRYVKRRWTVDQIAKESGTTAMTVWRWLEKFELLKNQRKK